MKLDAFRRIAERIITEAVERGELDSPGSMGRPLVFEDERWIPEDLRMGYRVLRNAGILPPEVELRKEISSLREMISSLDDGEARTARLRELEYKLMKLRELRPGLSIEAGDRIIESLMRDFI